MGSIQIFKVFLTDPRGDMTLTGIRDFDAGYSIETESFGWSIFIEDARRLAFAAKRIAWAAQASRAREQTTGSRSLLPQTAAHDRRLDHEG